MALPVILIDSATGSDTQASGAGPSTALFGTTDASTDGAGTTVTLTASTDLSGVATDGSHVIFLNNSTAGARNFAKITGTAGSGGATPTVTVSEAFAAALTTKSWAIGGKRASVGGSTSLRLFDNNAAAGDAMTGWAIELQSGHAETVTGDANGRIIMRRAGTASNRIELRGVSGAATLPRLTFTVNTTCFFPNTYWTLKNFEIRNSNATKTASVAIYCPGLTALSVVVQGMKISHSTDKFWKGVDCHWSTLLRDSEIGYCASVGVLESASDPRALAIVNNYIHDCGSHAIVIGGATGFGIDVRNNIIASNSGSGIDISTARSSGDALWDFDGNTFVSNVDAIKISSNLSTPAAGLIRIVNNQFKSNTGYALNFSSGSVTAAVVAAAVAQISCNNHYSNTSGFCNLTLTSDENTTNLDPSFTNAGGGDYSIGTATKALGHPIGGTLPVGRSSTYSYVDPGAAQREEAGAGGGTVNLLRGKI